MGDVKNIEVRVIYKDGFTLIVNCPLPLPKEISLPQRGVMKKFEYRFAVIEEEKIKFVVFKEV
jgi:hypothetical protein